MSEKVGIRPARDHYVYLYRDLDGAPLYVGYGKRVRRALSHPSNSHNRRLLKSLASGRYTLEIAGPFGDEKTGRTVESALISSLNSRHNEQPGERRYRFRPLGVPEKFSDRILEAPLSRAEFCRRMSRRNPAILFVCMSQRKLNGLRGYDPVQPPDDATIRDRAKEWWRLGRQVRLWSDNPSRSPGLLVALAGKPDFRVVVASMKINTATWSSTEGDPGYFSVPIDGPRDLDAFGLRGYRVHPSARMNFGRFNTQFFIILNANGSINGGSQRKR